MSATPPALTLTTEDHGETVIVHCRGKLTFGVTDLVIRGHDTYFP